MSDDIDLLQIKIENAKKKLPQETQDAISAVDWRAPILEMREKKGYSFEQLGDLELETELVLAGLTAPENYPKELATRMGIPQAEANALVAEMNLAVFQKIREELIKNTLQAAKKPIPIIIKPEVKKPEPARQPVKLNDQEITAPAPHPLLAQKFSGITQTPAKKTEHTLEKLSKPAPVSYSKNADPYRLQPEE